MNTLPKVGDRIRYRPAKWSEWSTGIVTFVRTEKGEPFDVKIDGNRFDTCVSPDWEWEIVS